jgi:hypothetical protein
MRKLLILLVALATTHGCGKTVTDFQSSSPLGEGIRAKKWRDPVVADDPIAAFGSGEDVFAQSFDLGVQDRTFTLAAVLTELTSGLNVGYVNSYYPITVIGPNTEGGWASYGSNSTRVVTLATGEAALAQFALGPTGTALALFQNSDGSALSAGFFSGRSWQSFLENDTGLLSTPVGSGLLYSNRVGLASTFDRYGRAFVAIPSVDASGNVQSAAIALNSSIAGATFSNPLSITAGALSSAELALGYDGNQTLCALYGLEPPDFGLYARCGKSTDASPFGASSTETFLQEGTARAMVMASDGVDRLMAVYALSTDGSHYGIYALSAANGVWDDAPTQLDLSLEEKGIQSLASVTQLDRGGSTGIVYLGSGRFLAAWIAVDTSRGVSTAYSSVWDAETGEWSSPKEVTDASLSVDSSPPHVELSLFSNQKDNAGIALRLIRESSGYSATPGTTTFQTQVSRYHSTSGWMPAKILGNGCTAGTSSSSLLRALPGCRHRAVGAIDSRGNALVVFQDQDEDGIYRLVSSEFR